MLRPSVPLSTEHWAQPAPSQASQGGAVKRVLVAGFEDRDEVLLDRFAIRLDGDIARPLDRPASPRSRDCPFHVAEPCQFDEAACVVGPLVKMLAWVEQGLGQVNFIRRHAGRGMAEQAADRFCLVFACRVAGKEHGRPAGAGHHEHGMEEAVGVIDERPHAVQPNLIALGKVKKPLDV
jgi:hypothetical protein